MRTNHRLQKFLIFVIATTITIQAQSILPHKTNKFNCITIDITEVPENFSEQLKKSLNTWQRERKNGVWLTIPIEHVELIPLAVKEGFIYHHAQAQKLVLTKWLASEENILPPYATRSVGVWALVIDNNNRILVVKEKYDKEWGYKFPSGAVKMGEDFKDAAVRETLEEAGIDTRFDSVIAWVERHDTRMDNISDISFICLLRPINNYIQLQESEITDALWMPYEEFKKCASGPQQKVLTAYEANNKGYVAYSCPDFPNYSRNNTMTLYACPEAIITQE